jgi:cytidylate kinase
MAIVTISRGTCSKGREVAEIVAQKLGYQCIGRELLLEASKEFNIPEIRLERAIHDAPSILERFTYGKERYIAMFQSAFLKYMRRDNVVYHGLAGHFFLKGVSHALKVRIIAPLEDRILSETANMTISAEAAMEMLKRDDQERSKWSRSLYGIDTADPALYDIVIRIGKITIPEIADIICDSVALSSLKTTYESQKAIEDLAIAADVKASLIDMKPDIQVFARNGHVVIGSSNLLIKSPDLAKSMEAIALNMPGVQSVEIKSTHLMEWAD